MEEFKVSGNKAMVKELDNNLIGKNVIDMLPGKSVTHAMMKILLVYLMFLKKKDMGRSKQILRFYIR